MSVNITLDDTSPMISWGQGWNIGSLAAGELTSPFLFYPIAQVAYSDSQPCRNSSQTLSPLGISVPPSAALKPRTPRVR
jgi:hypothetical protein